MTDRHRARQQQKIEELSATSLRALTGNALLHFERGRLCDEHGPLPAYAPHGQLRPAVDTLASYRGVADGLALRLNLSDAVLHRRLRPAQPIERLIFDWLEQLRVESLAPEHLPGLRHNLIRRYQHWTDTFLGSGAIESSLGILLFSFSQIIWSRLMAHELPEHIQDLMEATRAGVAPSWGTALAGLRRYRRDQTEYAQYALMIARDLAERVQHEYEDNPETVGGGRGSLMLAMLFEQDQNTGFERVSTGESAVFTATGASYRVFTRRYDREVEAAELLRPALLQEYRAELDRMLEGQGVNVARLARASRALLTQPETNGWRFGEEEGVIDGRRLAQLISSPGERRVFRRDRIVPQSDCGVTFLVDCSGSMKQYNIALAMMMDVFMRALGQAGVATEILGFTTLAWNGGRAKSDWFAHGRPDMPGRLNETCHLVFKDADTSWRRARSSIVAMMKPDLFREGIDGEAVEWACRRLLQRPWKRRILVVVSDGCPSDSATNLANDDHYLDNHLKAVVKRYTTPPAIDIVGLGVGLDLSPYYSRSLAIDLSNGVDNSIFDELLAMLARPRRLSGAAA